MTTLRPCTRMSCPAGRKESADYRVQGLLSPANRSAGALTDPAPPVHRIHPSLEPTCCTGIGLDTSLHHWLGQAAIGHSHQRPDNRLPLLLRHRPNGSAKTTM